MDLRLYASNSFLSCHSILNSLLRLIKTSYAIVCLEMMCAVMWCSFIHKQKIVGNLIIEQIIFSFISMIISIMSSSPIRVIQFSETNLYAHVYVLLLWRYVRVSVCMCVSIWEQSLYFFFVNYTRTWAVTSIYTFIQFRYVILSFFFFSFLFFFLNFYQIHFICYVCV